MNRALALLVALASAALLACGSTETEPTTEPTTEIGTTETPGLTTDEENAPRTFVKPHDRAARAATGRSDVRVERDDDTFAVPPRQRAFGILPDDR